MQNVVTCDRSAPRLGKQVYLSPGFTELSLGVAIRIGLEWFLNVDHLPFLVPQFRQWDRELGEELEIVQPPGHFDGLAMLERGELDLAITEPLHLVQERAAGRPFVGVARFFHTNGGVMCLKSSGIDRPRDMVGARIQYPGAPGPNGPGIVRAMIEADGGTANDDDFQRINRGFQHTDALIDGDADVATLVFGNYEPFEARHRGHDVNLFSLKHWKIPDFCQLIVVTTPEVLKRDPDKVRNAIALLRRGLDEIYTNADACWTEFCKAAQLSSDDAFERKVYDATRPCFSFDLSMSPSFYVELATWLHSKRLTQSIPAPEELWTNDFAFA